MIRCISTWDGITIGHIAPGRHDVYGDELRRMGWIDCDGNPAYVLMDVDGNCIVLPKQKTPSRLSIFFHEWGIRIRGAWWCLRGDDPADRIEDFFE